MIEGERLTVSQISSKYGLKPATIFSRLAKGWVGADLVKPVHSVPEFKCATCGKTFKSSASNERIYCSVACVKFGPKSHGDSYKRLHRIWCSMRSRCKGTNNKAAKMYYRDRGISVCDEWSRYEVFRDWALANGYADDLEIDRIDNSGNYEPSNCRWVDRRVQSINRGKCRKANVVSQYKGVSRTPSSRLKPWRATGRVQGKPKHLGCFATEEEAARAWDAWAVEAYGQLAPLNFGGVK